MDDNFMYDIMPENINSLEELEAWKNKYDGLTYYQRKVSNEMSTEKYGKTNLERYNEKKKSFIANDPEKQFDAQFDVLSAVKEDGASEAKIASHDAWKAKIEKARQQESLGLIILVDTRKEDEIDDYDMDEMYYIKRKYDQFLSLNQNKRSLSNQTAYTIFGYNNYSLYTKIMNTFLSRKDSVGTESPSEEDDRLVQDAIDVYPYYDPSDNTKNSEASSAPVSTAEAYTWSRTLKDLTGLIESMEDSDKRDALKEQVASMGWNPEIPFDEEKSKYAWMRYNRIQECRVIDLTEGSKEVISDAPSKFTSEYLKDKIVPVFVTLVSGNAPHSKGIRWFTDSKWSHAAMGFDSSLSELYSFNLYTEGLKLKSGFSIESIGNTYMRADKNMETKVYALFVTPEQRKQMREAIQWYIDNKETTSYNFGNILSIALRKVVNASAKDKDSMICSQFVYSILRLANFKLRKSKEYNMVTPADLDDLSDDARFYCVYQGRVKDYDKKKVDKLCYDLLPTLPTSLYTNESMGFSYPIPKSAIGKSEEIFDRMIKISEAMLK